MTWWSSARDAPEAKVGVHGDRARDALEASQRDLRAYAHELNRTLEHERASIARELHDEMGKRLRDNGNEYGAVTGRPRRCGWFDAVAVRYAVRVNGLDVLAVTKMDVLDGLESIQVCNCVVKCAFGDLASHLRGVEDLVIEYRVVKCQAQTDWVRGLQIFSDDGGFLVAVLGLLLHFLAPEPSQKIQLTVQLRK